MLAGFVQVSPIPISVNEFLTSNSRSLDPPADGKMIAEQRQAVLTAKLKELGDYGVKRRTVEESPFFDPPAELELERSTPAHPPEKADEPKEEVISAAPASVPRKAKSHKEDLEAFRETYLQPARISHRKAVYVLSLIHI